MWITFTICLLSVFALYSKSDDVSRSKNLTICHIWEDDTYFSTYERLAAAVDLAVDHANTLVLPKQLSLRSVYKSAGNSCARTMYNVVANVYTLTVDEGVECNAFIGASKSHTNILLYGSVKTDSTVRTGTKHWYKNQKLADQDFSHC